MVPSFVAMRSVLLACSLSLIAALASAQTWPSKPIRLVVPYPPGGSNDQLARYLGAKLQETLGPAGPHRQQGRRQFDHRQRVRSPGARPTATRS